MNDHAWKPIKTSEVGELCQDFLTLRRALGRKYDSEEKVLRQFVRHCEQEISDSILPEDSIYDWITTATNQSLKTRSNKASVLIQWAQYLFDLGYEPLRLPTVRYSANTAFVPHIYTAAELQAIWNTVDHIKPSKVYPNLHRCIPVLFRLLYGCGLRIHEALQITLDDIDFTTNVITLRHAKLDKERLIPLSESLAKALSVYAAGQAKDMQPGAPLFYYRKGCPLTQRSVYSRFRMTLQDSGIPYQGQLRGPRLHDFRHTFAVSTMNRLVDQNNDIYVVLPILSAYLGHSGVKSTERYIRLTEERLSTITDTIGNTLSNIFPEVEKNAEI